MRCPYCGHCEQRVLDSRPARDGSAIRRRRECDQCNRRFTTFEEPERPRLIVVKRDGTREAFDREKVLNSMVLACGKRPVSFQDMQSEAEGIELALYNTSEPEVSTTDIGDLVMDSLFRLDAIAYIRFASVYRAFDSPKQFAEIVRRMQVGKSAQPDMATVR